MHAYAVGKPMRDRRKRLLCVERGLQCGDFGARQRAAHRHETIALVKIGRGRSVVACVHGEVRTLPVRLVHLDVEAWPIGNVRAHSGTTATRVDPGCQCSDLRFRERPFCYVTLAAVRTDLGGCVVVHCDGRGVRTTGQGKHTHRDQDRGDTRSHDCSHEKVDQFVGTAAFLPAMPILMSATLGLIPREP